MGDNNRTFILIYKEQRKKIYDDEEAQEVKDNYQEIRERFEREGMSTEVAGAKAFNFFTHILLFVMLIALFKKRNSDHEEKLCINSKWRFYSR